MHNYSTKPHIIALMHQSHLSYFLWESCCERYWEKKVQVQDLPLRDVHIFLGFLIGPDLPVGL